MAGHNPDVGIPHFAWGRTIGVPWVESIRCGCLAGTEGWISGFQHTAAWKFRAPTNYFVIVLSS